MPISNKVKEKIESSSWIRKMFEEGNKLKQEFGAENVYDFSLGNPDIEPPEAFNEVIDRIVNNKDAHGLHGYMPNAGFVSVREKISEKVRKEHGTNIDSGGIIMTVGAAGGLNVIFKTILNADEEVIVPVPYFVEYGAYIDNHNGKMVLTETNDDFSLNVENIEKKINSNTKAILINSPHNPTGQIYSNDEIVALSNMLKKYQAKGQVIYLIADEPYREIVYDNIEVPQILSNYDNSLVVTSYSKTLSVPGERIGYIAVNPNASHYNDLIAGLTMCNRTLGFVNAPALMQLVVAELLSTKVDVEKYKRRRDLLIKGLTDAKLEFIFPKGAFYIFCKSPIEDDIEFVKHLKKYRILAVPGSGFGAKGYFRLAYCVDENVIENSLPKFKEAMDNL